MTAPTESVRESVERILTERKQEKYVLRLYVSGLTVRSMQSIAALTALCEQLVPGRYDLEVVNLAEHPELAELEQIFATPTLVKELPPPVQRLVGDLTQPDRVIVMPQ